MLRWRLVCLSFQRLIRADSLAEELVLKLWLMCQRFLVLIWRWMLFAATSGGNQE